MEHRENRTDDGSGELVSKDIVGLRCSKCGKLYQIKRALEKHVRLCVKHITTTRLLHASNNLDQALLKVTSRPPEYICKAATKKQKVPKVKQQAVTH